MLLSFTEVQHGFNLLQGEVVVVSDSPPPGDLPLLVLLVVSDHVIVSLNKDLLPPAVLLAALVFLIECLGEVQEASIRLRPESDEEKRK